MMFSSICQLEAANRLLTTYQAVPIVFDCLSEGRPRCEGEQKTNILIVVSPLVSLMKDQVDRLDCQCSWYKSYQSESYYFRK